MRATIVGRNAFALLLLLVLTLGCAPASLPAPVQPTAFPTITPTITEPSRVPIFTPVLAGSPTESPAPEIPPFAIIKQTLEAATYTNAMRESYYTQTLGFPMQAHGPFEIAFTLNVRDEGGDGVSGGPVPHNSFSISSNKGSSINFDKSRSSWSVRVVDQTGATTSYPLPNAAQNPYSTFTFRVLDQDQAQVIINGRALPTLIAIGTLSFFNPDTQFDLKLVAAPQATNKLSGAVAAPNENNLTVIQPTPTSTPAASPTVTSSPTSTPTRRPAPTATPTLDAPPALDFVGETPAYDALVARLDPAAPTMYNNRNLITRSGKFRTMPWPGAYDGSVIYYCFMLPGTNNVGCADTGRGSLLWGGRIKDIPAKYTYAGQAWERLKLEIDGGRTLYLDVPLTGVQLAVRMLVYESRGAYPGNYPGPWVLDKPGIHSQMLQVGDAVLFMVHSGLDDNMKKVMVYVDPQMQAALTDPKQDNLHIVLDKGGFVMIRDDN